MRLLHGIVGWVSLVAHIRSFMASIELLVVYISRRREMEDATLAAGTSMVSGSALEPALGRAAFRVGITVKCTFST